MDQTVKERVGRHLAKKMKDYEVVANQFKKFFTSESLQEQLDKKIDAENVKSLFNLKVSKKEFD